MTTSNDSIFLQIKRDSELASLLERLATQPAIRTKEVEKFLTQDAKQGDDRVPVSPTRAVYVLDLLAAAVEGKRTADRLRKGVVAIRGIKDAIRTETPGHKLAGIVEKHVEIVEAPKAPEAKPEPKTNGAEVEVAGAKGAPVQVAGEITVRPGGTTKAGDIEITFPEAPALPVAMANYVKPDWYARMALALDSGKHVALAGPPGIGKSTGPEQYFIHKGQPFVTVNGDAGLRRRDLVGSVELSDGTTRFVCAEYAAAAIFGWGCILNEVNAADPDALLFMNGQMEVPFTVNIHGRSFPVHKDFRLVVTLNDGLVGTKPLPQAFRDRFFPIKVNFPDEALLRKVIVAKTGIDNVHPAMVHLLRYARKAWDLTDRGQMRYQLSPRRLFDVCFLLKNGTTLRDAIRYVVVEAVPSKPDAEQLERLAADLA